MRKTKFPKCCGIDIISELGSGSASETAPAKASNELFLETLEKSIKKSAAIGGDNPRGLLLAVTSVQNGNRRALLEKRGFVVLRENHNPNSGNKITLLGLDLTKEKAA